MTTGEGIHHCPSLLGRNPSHNPSLLGEEPIIVYHYCEKNPSLSLTSGREIHYWLSLIETHSCPLQIGGIHHTVSIFWGRNLSQSLTKEEESFTDGKRNPTMSLTVCGGIHHCTSLPGMNS
jgi:hypothetical protein